MQVQVYIAPEGTQRLVPVAAHWSAEGLFIDADAVEDAVAQAIVSAGGSLTEIRKTGVRIGPSGVNAE